MAVDSREALTQAAAAALTSTAKRLANDYGSSPRISRHPAPLHHRTEILDLPPQRGAQSSGKANSESA